MKPLIIAVLILSTFVLNLRTVSAQTPTDYNQWEIEPGKYLTTAGEPKQNYQDVSGWHEIDNTYINIGDSVLQCTTAIFQSRVYPNGVSEITIDHDGQEYVFTQQLVAIGLLNTDNQNRYIIDGTMNWNNVSFDSNVVDWGSVSPGVKYKIIHENTSVAHQITYTPNFIDSLIALLNQRPDSANISLVNLMKYTMSSNLDNPDSLYDNIPRRRLKRLGRIGFEIGEQFVHFPGSDTMPRLRVRQYYKLISDTLYMLEAIPGNRIKQIFTAYPDSAIWHNTLYQDTITVGRDDVFIEHGTDWLPDASFLIIGNTGGAVCDAGFRFQSVSIDNANTITSAFMYLKASGNESAVNCHVKFYCEDVDNAVIFADDSTAFNTRVANKTTANVDWDPPSFSTNVVYESPDIKTIIQVIVNRGGWSNGNDIVIFILDNSSDSNHRRGTRTRDSDPDNAAYVKIFHEAGGEPGDAVPDDGLNRGIGKGIFR